MIDNRGVGWRRVWPRLFWIVLLAWGARLVVATDKAAAEVPPSVMRFGAAMNQSPWYYPNHALLEIGWYHNWGLRPSNRQTLPGLDFHPTVGAFGDLWGNETEADLHKAISLTPTSYPSGTVWFVGNEMQYTRHSTANGVAIPPRTITAEEYAQKYKKYYDMIKGIDPTFRVGTGAFCYQGGPPYYLQQVRAAYEARYGSKMPVDVYNMHIYLNAWNRNDTTDLVRAWVTRMRELMATYSDRDKPLIITELGSLDGWDYPGVIPFLNRAFDYLSTATSSTLGCPSDGNRMVQRWAWFALTRYNDSQAPDRWSGTDLVDRVTGELTPLGLAFASYIKGPPQLPSFFYGNIKLNGQNVYAGIPVSVWISGTQVAQTTTIITGGDSVYAFDVPADDPDTTQLEGGVEGAQASFKVGTAFAGVTGVWHGGTVTALDLNLTGNIGDWRSINVSLVAGWNLISTPFSPTNTLITNVLSTINGHYDLLYSYAAAEPSQPWKRYNTTAPAFLNNLNRIDEKIGFWIRTDAAATLALTGMTPATTTQTLVAGWNLVGYPSEVARPVTEALASIAGKYDLVYTYDAHSPTQLWKKYNVTAPPFLNTLTTFVPGGAYWVRMTEAAQWVPE